MNLKHCCDCGLGKFSLNSCSCECNVCTGKEDDSFDTEYFDDDPSRKPKGKTLHKFPHKGMSSG